MSISEAISPQLPIGAGRTFHKIWPGIQQNITITGSGMTSNVTPRPGTQDYSDATLVAYGGASAVGAVQDQTVCYNIHGASAGGAGGAMAWQDRLNPPVGKLPQNLQSLGTACYRIIAMIKGGLIGTTNGDAGIQVCQGTRFPSFTIFGDATSGFQFGPRSATRISFQSRFVQGGAITLDVDVAANFMASIDPNTWNQYEMRILGATKQSNAVIKCLVNGIQVLGDIVIDAAAIIPGPWYLPNNSSMYTLGVINRGADNSPNLYVHTVELMGGPNETSLL